LDDAEVDAAIDDAAVSDAVAALLKRRMTMRAVQTYPYCKAFFGSAARSLSYNLMDEI
jgi:hypothetical protein